MPTATTSRENSLGFEVSSNTPDRNPGPQQLTSRVRLQVPGKHFPNLQLAEQQAFYLGSAVESKERHPGSDRRSWLGWPLVTRNLVCRLWFGMRCDSERSAPLVVSRNVV